MNSNTILITGASSGIGEACAEAFARQGWRLIVSSRRESKLIALKTKLEQLYGSAVYVLPMDVRSRADVEKALLAGVPRKNVISFLQ